MLSVVFVLAATLTLLPAVLAKLGPRVDKARAAAGCTRGEHRSRALRRAGASGSGGARIVFGSAALAVLLAARAAGPRPEDRHAVDQGRPRRRLLPRRATSRSSRPSGPARPARSRSSARAEAAAAPRPSRGATRASPASSPPQPGADGARADRGDPDSRPLEHGASAARSTGCAPTLPPGALVGGAAAENHDLETRARRQDAARDRRRPRRSASCSCWSRSRRR